MPFKNILSIYVKDISTSHVKIWQNKYEMKITNNISSRNSQVCTIFGCFNKLTSKAFSDPSSLETINVQFWLYTKNHQNDPQIVNYRDLEAIFRTDFNQNDYTKLIVHGFNNHCNSPTIKKIKEGLFTVSKSYNVFCVDWEGGAKMINYIRAAENSQIVSLIIVKFLNLLQQKYGDMGDKLHFIGYSLGAHISGSVGRHLKNINRISGLDPAGPIFNGLKDDVKLDPTDANFVDVIHSDGGSIKGLGTFQQMGDLDFYPNGGKNQPGCLGLAKEIFQFIKGDMTKFSCRHRRGPLLFAASMIPNCKFIGFSCSSYTDFVEGKCFAPSKKGIEMGYFSKKSSSSRERIFLLTKALWPFCGMQYLVMLEFKTPSGEHYWKKKSLSLVFVGNNTGEESVLLTTLSMLQNGVPLQ